jgi:hypothetical protein
LGRDEYAWVPYAAAGEAPRPSQSFWPSRAVPYRLTARAAVSFSRFGQQSSQHNIRGRHRTCVHLQCGSCKTWKTSVHRPRSISDDFQMLEEIHRTRETTEGPCIIIISVITILTSRALLVHALCRSFSRLTIHRSGYRILYRIRGYELFNVRLTPS